MFTIHSTVEHLEHHMACLPATLETHAWRGGWWRLWQKENDSVETSFHFPTFWISKIFEILGSNSFWVDTAQPKILISRSRVQEETVTKTMQIDAVSDTTASSDDVLSVCSLSFPRLEIDPLWIAFLAIGGPKDACELAKYKNVSSLILVHNATHSTFSLPSSSDVHHWTQIRPNRTTTGVTPTATIASKNQNPTLHLTATNKVALDRWTTALRCCQHRTFTQDTTVRQI